MNSKRKNSKVEIQEEEIDDFMWLAYDQAMGFLSFENDKKILREAVDFLLKNNLIVTKDIPLPQDVQKEMEIKENVAQKNVKCSGKYIYYKKDLIRNLD
jgi:hypothetical protein